MTKQNVYGEWFKRSFPRDAGADVRYSELRIYKIPISRHVNANQVTFLLLRTVTGYPLQSLSGNILVDIEARPELFPKPL